MSEQQSRRMFKAGDIILKQGEKGDCAYIIEDGQVEISICRSDGNTQIISTRGPGTIIGEMAIVDEAPRVATVKALKDCKMLEITREDFAQRLKSSDPVIQMISQVILTRFRDTLTRAEILHESAAVPPPETEHRRADRPDWHFVDMPGYGFGDKTERMTCDTKVILQSSLGDE